MSKCRLGHLEPTGVGKTCQCSERELQQQIGAKTNVSCMPVAVLLADASADVVRMHKSDLRDLYVPMCLCTVVPCSIKSMLQHQQKSVWSQDLYRRYDAGGMMEATTAQNVKSTDRLCMSFRSSDKTCLQTLLRHLQHPAFCDQVNIMTRSAVPQILRLDEQVRATAPDHLKPETSG